MDVHKHALLEPRDAAMDCVWVCGPRQQATVIVYPTVTLRHQEEGIGQAGEEEWQEGCVELCRARGNPVGDHYPYIKNRRNSSKKN